MIFDKFYNGQGKSKYDQTGFDNLVNVDVHSEQGALKCQLALASESTTPNEPCISVEDTSGNTYFFSTSTGKTWKRDTNASYSLVNTNANGAHAGARYFNGYIYYATSTKLGRFNLVSTWTDTFQTFTQTTSYRPMEEINLSLFIGNGKYVASVDNAATFSDNVLDLPSNYSVTALVGVGTDLLIGTIIGTNVNFCKVFLWDTYSSSWTVEDEIPEIGVNCFIPSDNITFAQCGTSGQLYYWTGGSMQSFKKIRGVTTSVNSYASTRLAGKPLFATGTKVFSIHRSDKDFPYVVVQEYTATTGTIASIIGVGTQLLVSTGSNIDKIGANYATAMIDTPEITDNTQDIEVYYDSIGGTGTIGISTNIDNGGYTAQTTVRDTIRKLVHFDGGLGTVNFLQSRITLTPDTTNNISIKRIITR
jgi:hypothetical protein